MIYPIGATELGNPSSAFMKVETDGSAVLITGAFDCGQGSSAALVQIVSRTIGISVDKIKLVSNDSQRTPFDNGPAASRMTYIAGNCVKRVAENCRKMLFDAAAIILGLTIGDVGDELRAEDGMIYLAGWEDCRVSIAEAAQFSLKKMGKPIVGAATFNPVTTILKKDTGHGKPYGTHTFATQIAIVDVDDETGWYDVKKIYAVHDCGAAINPMLLKGQIDGGIAMGLGFGCMEELICKGGKVQNDQFADYLIPTAMDVPEIVADYVERYDPAGPYGAKGIAEPALLPTASAIANAIHDAVGVLIADLPVTPEKIFLALQAKKAAEAK